MNHTTDAAAPPADPVEGGRYRRAPDGSLHPAGPRTPPAPAAPDTNDTPTEE